MSGGPFRRAAHRLRDARLALGTAGLVWTGPGWLARREYLVTVMDLRHPPPPVMGLSGLAWRPLARGEVERVVAGSPTLSEPEARRRLRDGQECWVAWLGDTPVHWRWEARRDSYLPYLRRPIRPLDRDLWVVDVYTHPAMRGRGLYAWGSALAMQRARDQGAARLIGLIAGWNHPARRVAEGKFQRAVVGSAGYWALGPRRYHFVTGEAGVDGEGRVFVRPPAVLAASGRPA
jgi:hypothetical protein